MKTLAVWAPAPDLNVISVEQLEPGWLVAVDSLFIANPDLPVRFTEDGPLAAPNPATFYGGDAKGYTDYPVLERA